MVEKMVKLTILFHRSERDDMLEELQRLGVLHIENFGVTLSPEVSAFKERVDRLTALERTLAGIAADAGKAGAEPAFDGGAAPPAYHGTPDELSEEVEALRAERDRLATVLTAVERDIAEVSRIGDLSAERAKALADAGLAIRLYSAPRSVADTIARDFSERPGYIVEPIYEERGTVHFAIVHPAKDANLDIPATPGQIPAESLATLDDRLHDVQRKIDDTDGKLDRAAGFVPWLSEELHGLRDELAGRIAHESLTNEIDGHALAVRGWVPVRVQKAVDDFLETTASAFLFEEAEAEEKAPVLLKNNGYARLFEPILRIYSLPNYHELDTTPFFAPFYTLFFGLCIADLGYGIVLSAAALVALLFMRSTRMRPLLYLGLVLSVSVLVCGFLLNDFFGVHVTELVGDSSFFRIFVFFRETNGNINGPMYFAIMLGIIQVMFGWVLRVVNEVRHGGVLAGLEPTGVAILLLGGVVTVLQILGPTFSVGPFYLGAWGALIPSGKLVGFALIAVGLVLILLFNNLETRMFLRPLRGLWNLFELASGTLGDVLSYLRLFALGLAGGLLAEAVLHIAQMVHGSSALGIVPETIVFLLGTGLNVAIGLLSAFVHSLRLTFVEFYKAIGFKGGGVAYAPFKRES